VPAGQVEFVRDGQVVAAVTLIDGAARFTTTPTKAAKITFVARYRGTPSHAASASGALVQTVKKR
jgi:hypothetical protein